MKEVKAYIKTLKESDVIEELHKIEGLTGATVLPVKAGFGREQRIEGPVRIVDNTVHFVPHVKLEVVCGDDLVESVVQAIQKGAHTGLREDGKIYVSDVQDAVRISTGERGEQAV